MKDGTRQDESAAPNAKKKRKEKKGGATRMETNLKGEFGENYISEGLVAQRGVSEWDWTRLRRVLATTSPRGGLSSRCPPVRRTIDAQHSTFRVSRMTRAASSSLLCNFNPRSRCSLDPLLEYHPHSLLRVTTRRLLRFSDPSHPQTQSEAVLKFM